MKHRNSQRHVCRRSNFRETYNRGGWSAVPSATRMFPKAGSDNTRTCTGTPKWQPGLRCPLRTNRTRTSRHQRKTDPNTSRVGWIIADQRSLSNETLERSSERVRNTLADRPRLCPIPFPRRFKRTATLASAEVRLTGHNQTAHLEDDQPDFRAGASIALFEHEA